MNTYVRDNSKYLFDPPMCTARKIGDISIPSATLTQMTLPAEDFDTDGMHDPTTNNSRITCNHAGVYHASASLIWAANNNGNRIMTIMLNNTTRQTQDWEETPDGTNTTHLNCAQDVQMNVNDYLEIQASQGTASGLNVNGGTDGGCVLSVHWVGSGV